MKLSLLSFALMYAGAAANLTAQVTVGANRPPNATLEVVGDPANASAHDGIIVPKVTRAQLITKTTAGTYSEGEKGALIYVIDTSGTATGPTSKITVPGFYMFSGTEWVSVGTPTASNGVTIIDNDVQLGGDLTDNTIISTKNKELSLNVGTGGSISVIGLRSEDYNKNSGAKAIIADDNTGKLSLAVSVPEGLAFFQSDGEQNIASNINGGSIETVTFNAGDRVHNNIVDLQPGSEFEFRSKGQYEISAFVCYCGSTATSGSPVLLNATLQVKYDGDTGWTDYSSVRCIWTADAKVYRQTLNIPPVLLEADSGDRIRMIVRRPPDENAGTGYLGGTHTVGNGTTRTGILVPFGAKHSKGLKILAVELQ